MKLTQEEINEIEAALASGDANKIVSLKNKYKIAGCSCKAQAKLKEFLQNHR